GFKALMSICVVASEVCIELRPGRQAGARAEPGALERCHRGSQTRAFRHRAPFGEHQCERTVEGITGARGIDDARPESGSMTALAALAPQVAVAAERDAGMLRSE